MDHVQIHVLGRQNCKIEIQHKRVQRIFITIYRSVQSFDFNMYISRHYLQGGERLELAEKSSLT